MNHQKIFLFGKDTVEYNNIPAYYDIMAIPFPSALDLDDSEDRLDFKGMLMDMGTGTYEPIFLSKIPIFQKTIDIFLPTRPEINKMVELQFLLEGRYLSFWFTAMEEDFRAVGYAPFYVPDEFEGVFKYNAGDKFFYSLNWGQKTMEDTYKQRVLLILYDGYSKLHFNKITTIDIMTDYRVIKVSLQYPLPEIYVSDIDVITTLIYTRNSKDEVKFNFVTSDIAYSTLELSEDYKNYYDPFSEPPKIYPEGV